MRYFLPFGFGMLWWSFTELSYQGIFFDIRFLHFFTLSFFSFFKGTGFPQGDAFIVISALAFVLSLKTNAFLSATLATFAYTAFLFFDQPHIFAHLGGGKIHELHSASMPHTKVSGAEYLYFLVLGKFLQFLVLIAICRVLFLAMSIWRTNVWSTRLKGNITKSRCSYSQIAFEDIKILLAKHNRERTK